MPHLAKVLPHFYGAKKYGSHYEGVLGGRLCVAQAGHRATPIKAYAPIPEFCLIKTAACASSGRTGTEGPQKDDLAIYLWNQDGQVQETLAGETRTPREQHAFDHPPLDPAFPRDAKRPVRLVAKKATEAEKKPEKVEKRVEKEVEEQAKGPAKQGQTKGLTKGPANQEKESVANRPPNRPANGPANQPANGPANQPANGPAKRPTNAHQPPATDVSAEQRALNKAVQQAAEEMALHPVVADRSSRWLRQTMEALAGPPGPDDISAPYEVRRAVPEGAKKAEALIRALNRLVNRTMLRIVTEANRSQTSTRAKRDAAPAVVNANMNAIVNVIVNPKRVIFPHLSQRNYWTADLLQLAQGLVPRFKRDLLLGIERMAKM
jgi:hypothetical protein